MQVTETLADGLKREFKVVIGASDLDLELNKRLDDLAKRANIKGFRPGKVPVPHLKRVYGKSVMAEVVQAQIDEGAKKIVEDRQLKPAYQPEVKLPEDQTEIEQIFAGKSDLAYTMSFEVVPDFELQDVSGIELDRHVVTVNEQHINEALQRIAAQSRAWKEKGDGAQIASGDRARVSFAGKINGEVFDGGTVDDAYVEIGSEQFIPGFEDQLIGAKKGDEVKVNVMFPESYGVPALAGKPAAFDVTIKDVEAPEEPQIDEEFAKNAGFESLDKLKEIVTERLKGEFDRMTAMKLKRDVLDALDKMYSFALPEKLVEAEFSAIWNALTSEMQRANKSFADEETTEEKARDEYKAIAERRVRLGLVLGTMGEKEGIKVADDELQRALIDRVRQFRGQEKQVFDYYRKNTRALLELRGPIFEQKVVDHIIGKAKVTDKPVTREELQTIVQDEDEHDHDHAHLEHDHAHDHDHHDHDHSHHDHAHDHGDGRA
jgi:trigger factor